LCGIIFSDSLPIFLEKPLDINIEQYLLSPFEFLMERWHPAGNDDASGKLALRGNI